MLIINLILYYIIFFLHKIINVLLNTNEFIELIILYKLHNIIIFKNKIYFTI